MFIAFLQSYFICTVVVSPASILNFCTLVGPFEAAFTGFSTTTYSPCISSIRSYTLPESKLQTYFQSSPSIAKRVPCIIVLGFTMFAAPGVGMAKSVFDTC